MTPKRALKNILHAAIPHARGEASQEKFTAHFDETWAEYEELGIDAEVAGLLLDLRKRNHDALKYHARRR